MGAGGWEYDEHLDGAGGDGLIMPYSSFRKTDEGGLCGIYQGVDVSKRNRFRTVLNTSFLRQEALKSFRNDAQFRFMERGGIVYILSNKNRTTFYTGVTSNLYARICDHREKSDETSFTARYNVVELLFFEAFESIEEAIQHEKKIKKWKREWKLNLIRSKNPEFINLFGQLDPEDF